MKLARLAGKYFLAAVFWIAVWFAAAYAMKNELLLPSPAEVLKRLGELISTVSFWKNTVVSLYRILLGAVCGVVGGIVFAAGTSHFKLAEMLISPLLGIIRATPVASFILLFLIWFGRDSLPSIICMLMVLPIVWGEISTAISLTDYKLLEVASVYKFSPWKKIRRIYVPSVKKAFFSACRTSMGLAWKAGIAAEVLTVPSVSIGKQLYESKLYLETVDLFAWTLVVVICSLIIEKILKFLLKVLEKKTEGGAIYD